MIEKEETVFDKLERAFPSYFGQLMFATYRPFLSSPLKDEGVMAFREFLSYLDHLPSFELTEQEQKCVEESSSSIDMQTLEEVTESKMQAIRNPEEWLNDHEEMIAEYIEFKKSSDYINSPMKKIYDKLQAYMLANHYYEVAIPLIRQFSDSYDSYYQKLEKANTVLVDQFQI